LIAAAEWSRIPKIAHKSCSRTAAEKKIALTLVFMPGVFRPDADRLAKAHDKLVAVLGECVVAKGQDQFEYSILGRVRKVFLSHVFAS
jgi:hypothetical protein